MLPKASRTRKRLRCSRIANHIKPAKVVFLNATALALLVKLPRLERALDDAVTHAYGWPRNLEDNEILERLFQLNQEHAASK